MAYEKIKSDRTLACAARLLLRRHRNLGDAEDLAKHEQAKAELARRGHTDEFGVYGWNDAQNTPESVIEESTFVGYW